MRQLTSRGQSELGEALVPRLSSAAELGQVSPAVMARQRGDKGVSGPTIGHPRIIYDHPRVAALKRCVESPGVLVRRQGLSAHRGGEPRRFAMVSVFKGPANDGRKRGRWSG